MKKKGQGEFINEIKKGQHVQQHREEGIGRRE